MGIFAQAIGQKKNRFEEFLAKLPPEDRAELDNLIREGARETRVATVIREATGEEFSLFQIRGYIRSLLLLKEAK